MATERMDKAWMQAKLPQCRELACDLREESKHRGKDGASIENRWKGKQLELATASEHGRELMNFIEGECFFGDLCFENSNGDSVSTPIPLQVKMEGLLERAAERRQLVLDGLRRGVVCTREWE